MESLSSESGARRRCRHNRSRPEFHRLLKPGGEALIYPQRLWRPAAIRHAPLRKALARFAIRQESKASVLSLRVTPVYMTVLQK